jgi:hypothetical protein
MNVEHMVCVAGLACYSIRDKTDLKTVVLYHLSFPGFQNMLGHNSTGYSMFLWRRIRAIRKIRGHCCNYDQVYIYIYIYSVLYTASCNRLDICGNDGNIAKRKRMSRWCVHAVLFSTNKKSVSGLSAGNWPLDGAENVNKAKNLSNKTTRTCTYTTATNDSKGVKGNEYCRATT